MNEFAVMCGGLLSAMVGLGHCFFRRGFGWAEDFERTRELTARVLYTIHIFLIPLLLFFSYLSFAHAEELAGRTPLGTAVSVFLSVFWLVRGLWQVFYFRPSGLPGAEKLLPLHHALVAVFFVLSVSYAVPAVGSLAQG